MFRLQDAREQRRGVILLVVLALLVLFAAVGLAFVYYAQSQADASAIFKDAQNGPLTQRPDVPPSILLDEFLGQLIWDLADTDPAVRNSALRGHSLARLMYGWDGQNPGNNINPYCGIGRLHTSGANVSNNFGLDDFSLVNYTWFESDGFIRDPERLGTRANASAAYNPSTNQWTGGVNAPYTYPDLNNMFVAILDANGNVLLPSYFRPWTGFGSLDPSNPNWTAGGPEVKYQVLRPRPADNPDLSGQPGTGFPAPADAGGDVQNGLGGTGYNGGSNDSIWLNLGSPVRQMPDGTKYISLYAPLIIPLDNRLNVNVHGNVANMRGTNPPGAPNHVSNQGWGPWEVSLKYAVNLPDSNGNFEWPYLLMGGTNGVGRYGTDGKPSTAGGSNQPGLPPHFYGQVDYDGCDEQSTSPWYGPSGQISLPANNTTPLSAFASYGNGYGNGSAAERQDHPSLYNYFQPQGDDKVFDPSNMKALLRDGSTTKDAATSDLYKLCPTNFANKRIRRLVTTLSYDLDQPGVTPWLWDVTTAPYQVQGGATDQAPWGGTVGFPALTSRANAPPMPSEFMADWRWQAINAAVGKVDLNRSLPSYPSYNQGTRYDGGGNTTTQFQNAQQARQAFAKDIYDRLVAATGAAQPANASAPTDAELMPLRWLAQLAVNIVDYIDEDDISTPFNFYTGAGASGSTSQLPRYWVFGTELPHVVLNEVLAEYQTPATPMTGDTFTNKFWVELYNPFQTPASSSLQSADGQAVQMSVGAGSSQNGNMPSAGLSYPTYEVVIATQMLPRTGNNDNVLGEPDVVRARTSRADDTGTTTPGTGGAAGTPGGPNVDFGGTISSVDGTQSFSPPTIAAQGYLLLGPKTSPNTAHSDINATKVPGGIPWLKSDNLTYTMTYTGATTFTPDDRTNGVTVLLRRLANPHVPYDPNPYVGGSPNQWYNPYITVDYMESVPLNNMTTPATAADASRGKLQPYASHSSQVSNQGSSAPAAGTTIHTFGQQNNPVPSSGAYDWLVHLDRQLISPMELLNVSGMQPWQLTHYFITGNAASNKFNHLVPWTDSSRRLYRAFEFLETGSRAAGVGVGGRVPGKVNINMVWDQEVFQGICDPQPSNDPNFTIGAVNNIFNLMISQRTPNTDGNGNRIPGSTDRPFLGMATGYTASGDAQFPNGLNIDNTLLRTGNGSDRLFQLPDPGSGPLHPYLKNQLLAKVYNNFTTKSNVFAVWLTVGFFQVNRDIDPNTGLTMHPVQLGTEIGLSNGTNIRHHIFAIVDRSALTVGVSGAPATVSTTPVTSVGPTTITPGSMAGISAGTIITVDNGSNQETVIVTAVNPPTGNPTTFTAKFAKNHAVGFKIWLPRFGNPGPQPQFSARDNSAVVPYFTIID